VPVGAGNTDDDVGPADEVGPVAVDAAAVVLGVEAADGWVAAMRLPHTASAPLWPTNTDIPTVASAAMTPTHPQCLDQARVTHRLGRIGTSSATSRLPLQHHPQHRDDRQGGSDQRQQIAVGRVRGRRPDPLGQRLARLLGHHRGSRPAEQPQHGQPAIPTSRASQQDEHDERHRRHRQHHDGDMDHQWMHGQPRDGVEQPGFGSESRHS